MADAPCPKTPLRLRLCVNYRANELIDSCGARGAKELAAALADGIAAEGLDIVLETSHCMNRCHMGPTLRVLPDGPFLQGAQAEEAPFLLEKFAQGDIEALRRLLTPRER